MPYLHHSWRLQYKTYNPSRMGKTLVVQTELRKHTLFHQRAMPAVLTNWAPHIQKVPGLVSYVDTHKHKFFSWFPNVCVVAGG